tara:strand:+ start:8351 stop:8629 length:279 start_codon:yes stop_codon:yes gene_type:complete
MKLYLLQQKNRMLKNIYVAYAQGKILTNVKPLKLMPSDSEPCMPNPRIRSLSNGAVQITIGNIKGIAKSHLSVNSKLRVFRLLWKANPENWK